MFRPSRKQKSSPPPSTKMNDVEKNVKGSGHQQNDHASTTTQGRHAKSRRRYNPFILIGLLLFVSLILITSTRTKRNWWLLVWIASIPVFMAGSVVVTPRLTIHERLIALAFVGAIACNQFPSYISSGIAAGFLTVFGVATRSRDEETLKAAQTNKSTKQASSTTTSWNPNTWSGQIRAIASSLLLVVVLLFDNFCVWVVAATNYASHDLSTTPPPLQDNGRLVQEWLFQTLLRLRRRDMQQLRALFNIQWALVAACGTSMVCCEVGLVAKRTLWGVAMRALVVLSVARMVRVISFLLTVLPSQVPNCYVNHFPHPPPSDWASWILVGLQPAANGGCNDLIVSGHATVTSVLACLSTSVSGNTWFATALWILLALDYGIEVYEGFHYSVDMWMGALITSMLWRILDIEPQPEQQESNKNSKPLTFQTVLQDLATRHGLWYAFPAAWAYMVVVVFPQAIVNYWVVVFCAYVVVATIKNGFSQYIQHVLLCTLYIALAVYL